MVNTLSALVVTLELYWLESRGKMSLIRLYVTGISNSTIELANNIAGFVQLKQFLARRLRLQDKVTPDQVHIQIEIEIC